MEWKELEIDNLPPDICNSAYEWRMSDKGESKYSRCCWAIPSILDHLMRDNVIYSFSYKKLGPLPPIAEEILKDKIDYFFNSVNSFGWNTKKSKELFFDIMITLSPEAV